MFTITIIWTFKKRLLRSGKCISFHSFCFFFLLQILFRRSFHSQRESVGGGFFLSVFYGSDRERTKGKQNINMNRTVQSGRPPCSLWFFLPFFLPKLKHCSAILFIFFFLRSFPSYLHYIIEGCVVLLLLLLLWTGWSGSRCCHEWENSSCTSFGRCCSGSDRRIPATCYCPHFAGRMPFDSGAIRFVTWNQFFQSFIQ